jgi:hypothetical protein
MKMLPGPTVITGAACDVMLPTGVYGWTNTSFSIMASLRRGWQDPMVLFPGQPQVGHVDKGAYQYYLTYIPEDATDVRFVLMPHEGGDQDLYLSVSRDKEPGKTQYDLKSTSWAGSDEIAFSKAETPSKWCTDCLVYLAGEGQELHAVSFVRY